MKISELIAELERVKAAHGDVEVLLDDPSDYGCGPMLDVVEPGSKPYINREPIKGVLLA